MSAAIQGIKVSLPIFGGKPEEFEDYQFSLRAYLGRHGLVNKLDDGELSDAEEKDVYYIIATSLTGDAIATVREVREGHGSWAYKALCERYASSRVSAKFSLMRKIMSTKCVNLDEIESWLNEIANARRRLEGMKVNWEEIAILGAIDNLPDEMRHVGDWVLAAEHVTFGQLKRVLLEKKDSQERKEHQSVKSMITTTQTGIKQERKPFCLFCGTDGHWAAACSQQVRGAGKGGKAGAKVCYACNKPGHFAKECRQKVQVAGASVAQLLCAATTDGE